MIGSRLAELREDKGLNQEELAKILSVSKTTISGYETNRNSPNDEIKVKIAAYFNVSLDYLLGAIDEETALNRKNVFVLPDNFPENSLDELLRYAVYLRDSANK